MVLINELIGSFGRYQLWLCFMIYLNKFGIALHHMAIIFLAPPTSYTCPKNASCCDDPVYDTSMFTRTIVTEWDLICDKAWLKDFTQTLFQLGVLIGSLVFGIASDRYGRRITLIVSVVIEVFSGIIVSFVPDFWTFTLIRMVLGFSIGGTMVIGFVILMEYVGNTHRDLVSALYHVPFTLGHMFLTLFGYYLRDYSYFQFAISVTNVVLLFYICFLPESPRWLLAMGRKTDSIKLTEHIAKVNNLPVEHIRLKIGFHHIGSETQMGKGSVVDLFRRPHLRKNIIIMSFNWLVCSYCFYGVSQYISYLSGNIYINVLCSAAVCICATAIAIPLMMFMGRKTFVITAHVISSVCLLVIAVIPDGIASVALGCIGVLFSFMVFLLIYVYCSELFPTVVRSAALGISSMMARVGAMIAPFVAGLQVYGCWCAPVGFGVFPLIAAISCYWLPETKNCELMTTVEESEAFENNLLNGNASIAETSSSENPTQ